MILADIVRQDIRFSPSKELKKKKDFKSIEED